MSGAAPKRKGSKAEREVVNMAIERGLAAERAYASNGRALGRPDTVDCLIAGKAIQVKRRRKIADYLAPPEGAHATAVRADRGPWLVVLTLDDYLALLEREVLS